MVDLVRIGTDDEGKAVWGSPPFAAWWAGYVDRLGFVPQIVQGGWMGDDAASASSTTHAGDALDLRLKDRTAAERVAMIREARTTSVAYWERGPEQGFELHAHLVPGPWAHPSPSALAQWNELLAGGDGLVGDRPDYHDIPLAPTPPEDDMTPAQAEQLDRIEADVKALATRVDQIGDRSYRRDEADRLRDAAARKKAADRHGVAVEKLDAILDELSQP